MEPPVIRFIIVNRLQKESILAGNTIETTFDVTGLSAGKDYYFTIVAYAGDVDNPGEPSEEVLFGTAPSIPSISKIKGGDKRIKVKWSKGTGADYFNIYYSKNRLPVTRQ